MERSVPGTENDTSRVSVDEVRWRLSMLWLAGAAAMGVLLILQSLLGKFGEDLQEVWSWFVAATVPTVSLMLGALRAGAIERRDTKSVQRRYFRLAWWLSLAYLVVLLSTFLIEPFSPMEPNLLFKTSNFWIVPMHGVVSSVIGFLFNVETDATMKDKEEEPKAG